MGFENYCGELHVLDEILGSAYKNIKLLQKIRLDDKIIIEYDYVMNSGNVDVEAYAQTLGNTIRFNKFLFDDTAFLIAQYEADVKDRRFPQGTTYKNIVDHEFGHLLDHKYRRAMRVSLNEKIFNVIQVKANFQGITVREYIALNISDYALSSNELTSEMLAKARGSEPRLARALLKEVGINAFN